MINNKKLLAMFAGFAMFISLDVASAGSTDNEILLD
jgi:hypothetical protein